jgi:hypothetical protein
MVFNFKIILQVKITRSQNGDMNIFSNVITHWNVLTAMGHLFIHVPLVTVKCYHIVYFLDIVEVYLCGSFRKIMIHVSENSQLNLYGDLKRQNQ